MGNRRAFLGNLAALTAGGLVVPASLDAAGAEPEPASADWDLTWKERITGDFRAVFDCPVVNDGAGLWRAADWKRSVQAVYGDAGSISGTESLTASGPGAATQEGQSAIKLYATPIDANYTNKYDYNFQAASTIRFKIVPVPPSPQAANLKVAPDVLGQPYSEVKKLLADLEIPYLLAPGSTEPIGYDPKVIVSDPKAGEILTGGQTIKLSLSAS